MSRPMGGNGPAIFHHGGAGGSVALVLVGPGFVRVKAEAITFLAGLGGELEFVVGVRNDGREVEEEGFGLVGLDPLERLGEHDIRGVIHFLAGNAGAEFLVFLPFLADFVAELDAAFVFDEVFRPGVVGVVLVEVAEEEVEALADRIVIINEGKLVAQGTKAELAAKVQNAGKAAGDLSLEEIFIRLLMPPEGMAA